MTIAGGPGAATLGHDMNEPSASQPPAVQARILTDLHVSEVPWWSQQLTVMDRPTLGGHMASVSAAWQAVRRASSFDVFISANVRNSLAVGLFKRLTLRRRPVLVMTEMRLDDPTPDLRWRLKAALQRFAYAAVDAMCVSARREAHTYAERLQVPVERFRFIPWHTNVLEPRYCPPSGGYLFAAGRTGRDWKTLAEAVRGLAVPVTVVCSKADARDVAFPDNVTVLTDIPYARYRELLEGATAVMVPLETHTYSSGQVVILEAMALGKAVIANRVLGTEDYIVDGVDGMLVAPGNAAELRAAVERLIADSSLAERLGRTALDKIRRTHTLDRYVRTVVALVEDLHRR